MALTQQEVQHIAELARLTLSHEELETYREQLSAILEYVDRLKQLDTEGVQPTTSVLNLPAALREDKPQAGFTPDQALRNAPRQQSDQFKVPPVME